MNSDLMVPAPSARACAISELFPDAGLFCTDDRGRYLFVSERWCKLAGIQSEQALIDGWQAAVHPDDLAGVVEAWQQSVSAGERFECRYRLRHWNGTVQRTVCRATAERDADGNVTGYTGILLEANGQASDDARAQEESIAERRLALALASMNDGLLDWNMQTGSAYVNPQYYTMLGYQPGDFLAAIEAFQRICDPDDARQMGSLMQEYLQGRRHEHAVEIRLKSKDGEWRWILSRGKLVERDSQGRPLRMLITHMDITDRKKAEEQIHTLAFYDYLTHLPNRRLLHDRMSQIMAGSSRSGHLSAAIFLDLDNFKVINDTRGHNFGDDLLAIAARRIQANVREQDTVARLGGDEFVVIVADLGEDSTEGAAVRAGAIGEKLREALSHPYDVDERHYYCTASLGITLFHGKEHTVETVLKQADLAMYEAKGAGRNTVRFFDPMMQTTLDRRSALESDLRLAVALGQLRLHYQPQSDRDGRIIGAEALLRWVHHEHGLMLPGHFIGLAEDTGLILPIGLWVLENACAQLYSWSKHPVTRALHLAVNVSALQFHLPEFVALVEGALAKTGADPTRLTIEITEGVVLKDVEDTLSKMKALRSLGLRLSLDDFGTGNSSLSYLSKLPLSELKIDKSFVVNLPDDGNDAIIAQTIITMATSLGLDVIAEGVETEAQRAFLQRHGCHSYQGYLYGRPLPLQEFQRFVTTRSQSGGPTGPSATE